jgi:hypothetical protein
LTIVISQEKINTIGTRDGLEASSEVNFRDVNLFTFLAETKIAGLPLSILVLGVLVFMR